MLQIIKNSRKILGMNSRNLEYIRPNNLKKAKQLADDKLHSKRLLKKENIPVPKLIAKISSYRELEQFKWDLLPASFALKPNRGFGGEGILVVYGKKKNENNVWIKADGSLITTEDLRSHIINILDGSYSLAGVADVAFFEERLQLLKLFKPYAYKGIPDIRVIVYNKVPVMAMLRIPTKGSDGKANLQQGAVGIGIDLATGTTTTAVYKKNKIIEYLPGTRLLLSGIRLPYWQDILKLAVKAQEVSGVGFLGADVAIDKEQGPVFLELNARPGLSIQIANNAGLKRRLERVEGLKIRSIEHGVRVGMNLFGGEIEGEVEDISGKKVIGVIEKVKIIGKEGKEFEVEAKIDTGAYSSSIDVELARQLGLEKTIEEFQKTNITEYVLKPENEKNIKKDFMEKYGAKIPDLADVAVIFSASGASLRPVVKVKIILDQVELVSLCNIISRTDLKHPAIIGKRNLGRFLIDVNKK